VLSMSMPCRSRLFPEILTCEQANITVMLPRLLYYGAPRRRCGNEAGYSENCLPPASISIPRLLTKALYWVAFQRLPLPRSRDFDMDLRISNDECERMGIAPDPRNSFDWAFFVNLYNDLEEISWEIKAGLGLDIPASHVAKLLEELANWKPEYKRAMELPAAKLYVALREGLLTARGKYQLHSQEPESTLEAMAKQIVGSDNDEIPKKFWSQHEIAWELSAARSGLAYYFEIHCNTDDVLKTFAHKDIISGVPVGVKRFGSIFVPDDSIAAGHVAQEPIWSGRPKKYLWDDFHLQLADLVRRNEMPDKKEAAIQYFRDWFIQRSGVSPSRTVSEWRPYIFAHDQWHCRMCGDRFLYSETVRKHIANEHNETMPPTMYEYFHGAVWQRKKLP
jgi:hypothetical protein